MEEGRWKEKLLEGEKELSLLERSGEDYQAALAAAQKLAEYRERMRALGLELESYNRGLGKLEKAREATKRQMKSGGLQTERTGSCIRDFWIIRPVFWQMSLRRAFPALSAAQRCILLPPAGGKEPGKLRKSRWTGLRLRPKRRPGRQKR